MLEQVRGQFLEWWSRIEYFHIIRVKYLSTEAKVHNIFKEGRMSEIRLVASIENYKQMFDKILCFHVTWIFDGSLWGLSKDKLSLVEATSASLRLLHPHWDSAEAALSMPACFGWFNYFVSLVSIYFVVLEEPFN